MFTDSIGSGKAGKSVRNARYGRRKSTESVRMQILSLADRADEFKVLDAVEYEHLTDVFVDARRHILEEGKDPREFSWYVNDDGFRRIRDLYTMANSAKGVTGALGGFKLMGSDFHASFELPDHWALFVDKDTYHHGSALCPGVLVKNLFEGFGRVVDCEVGAEIEIRVINE